LNLIYTVGPEDSGKNVKHILKNNLELSERLIKKLKTNGRILCNSRPVYVNAIVQFNDIIETDINFDEECDNIQSENIELDIIYEDEALIAINKRPFMVVHPTFNHQSGTIANGLIHYFNSKGIIRKIRPVSRLDRDTSGIIIFAKNEYVQESLIRQMKDKLFKKEYYGIVYGKFKNSKGTINLPIDRKPESIMLRHISDSGSIAVTHFEVIQYFNNATFLKFELETGRTHQIRVHCQAIGHPLIGDTLYSFLPESIPFQVTTATLDETIINRQALHSFNVNFLHPLSKKPIEINAPIPNDIENLLQFLEIAGK
jgi:23S rRNA pseudouridine1911/1915/1917 synthase